MTVIVNLVLMRQCKMLASTTFCLLSISFESHYHPMCHYWRFFGKFSATFVHLCTLRLPGFN